MEKRKTSLLYRCLAYNGGVSLTLIDGGAMCTEGIALQKFAGEKARAFGGALLCTAFLGSLLKENGEVSALIKTDGELQNITASASSSLNVRACMDCHEENGEENGEEAKNFYGGSGFLQVVRSDDYSLRPFVGACALKSGRNNSENGETAERFFEENFEEYFSVSEQLPTRFKLVIDEANGEENGGNGGEYLCAALQALPGSGEKWEESAKEKLSAFLKEYKKMKNAESAARKVFGEISCEERRELAYKCNCSQEYLKGVLASLGKAELENILKEQGEIKIHCHYCNKDYAFTRNDLREFL